MHQLHRTLHWSVLIETSILVSSSTSSYCPWMMQESLNADLRNCVWSRQFGRVHRGIGDTENTERKELYCPIFGKQLACFKFRPRLPRLMLPAQLSTITVKLNTQLQVNSLFQLVSHWIVICPTTLRIKPIRITQEWPIVLSLPIMYSNLSLVCPRCKDGQWPIWRENVLKFTLEPSSLKSD